LPQSDPVNYVRTSHGRHSPAYMPGGCLPFRPGFQYGHNTRPCAARTVGKPSRPIRATAPVPEPDAPEPNAADAGRWEPVQRAIDGEYRDQPGRMPTLEGVRSALAGVTP
jgi:hypothetical protein